MNQLEIFLLGLFPTLAALCLFQALPRESIMLLPLRLPNTIRSYSKPNRHLYISHPLITCFPTLSGTRAQEAKHRYHHFHSQFFTCEYSFILKHSQQPIRKFKYHHHGNQTNDPHQFLTPS